MAQKLFEDRLTITGEDNELIIVRYVMSHNVWESGNNLLLWGEVGTLLEFEITNGT